MTQAEYERRFRAHIAKIWHEGGNTAYGDYIDAENIAGSELEALDLADRTENPEADAEMSMSYWDDADEQ